MKLISQLILLSLLLPGLAAAALPPAFIGDFKPLDGTIIMPAGDEFLIDLDGSDGLREGDILTLIAPGELIIHPVSKEVLGRLDAVKGFLQVTRIKSGYSYARVLKTDIPVDKGAKIRRFEQVPSRFVDQQGEGGSLRESLIAELPQLKWVAEEDPAEAMLNFTLEKGTLTVSSASGKLLHSYPLSGGRPIASPMPQYRDPLLAAPKKEPKLLDKAVKGILETIGSTATPGTFSDEILRQDLSRQGGIWTSPSLTGSPVGLAVADFDSDQQQEVAVAFSKSLQIARVVDGTYQPLQKLEIPTGIFLLGLDSIDLDHNGTPELYLTAVKEGHPASLLVEFQESEFRIVIREIPWFMRVVDLLEEGRTLIAQQLSDDGKSFSGQPFRVLRDGLLLKPGPPLALPAAASLYGFVPFQDKSGATMYAYLTAGDYLNVSNASGEILWESSDYFGGSDACVEIKETALSRKTETLREPLCLRSRLLLNPAGEILVPQNDGQRFLKNFRTFEGNRLLAMAWNGHALVESWRTLQQQGYLADTVLADIDNDGLTELTMAIQFKYESILGDARSAVVSFELAQ
jgi:hypothetical protein